jgi:predicted RND superfamily exporter protein
MNILLRLIRLMLRHRVIAGLLLLLSVVAAAYQARTIEVRFQYKDFYDYPGNPRLPLLNRYSEEFGDPGGFVVLLIENQDVFSAEILAYVDSLTKQLESLDQFKQVISLTNAHAIRAVDDGVESGTLFRRPPVTPEEVERLRRTALSSSLLVRRLVAPDSTATAVLSEMRTPAALATVPEQKAAVDAVAKVMRSTRPPPGVRAQVTGAPLVEVETTRALVKDQLTLTPAVLLILAAALALTFRSIHGILLPLAAVTVSLVWTAGVFSFLHHPIDIVGSIIPTALLVYGVVDPIFVYTRYLDKLQLSRTREQAVLEAMRELLLPCFVTSFTTALGFAAFITATLPMIKFFGIVVGLGVLFAFVTTVTVLPLLLVSVGPSEFQTQRPWIATATSSLMRHIWQVARSRPELMVAAALSMLIAGAAAAYDMSIVNEYVGVLPKGRVQEGVRLLEQKLSGVVRVVVYLEGEPGSLKRPEVLRAIEAVDRFAEQQPVVTSSLSLADLVLDTNRAFLPGDPEGDKIPDSEPLISQYLSFVDPRDISDFVNSDYSRSHIRILLSDRGGKTLWELRDGLQREIATHFPLSLGVKATLTGYGVVAYQDLDRVVVEVLEGFLIAFGLIVLVQLVMFRSLRVALISIVPNVVPVCACFLLMRALGLHLRVDNSLVLCISVGGLFNTTIHIIARVLQQVRSGVREPDVIMARSLEAVGPPSLYTAVILSFGFSAMGLSRFPGLQMLGLLCLVTLLSGFVADAFLTTSFMRLFFGWKKAERWPAPEASPSREPVL